MSVSRSTPGPSFVAWLAALATAAVVSPAATAQTVVVPEFEIARPIHSELIGDFDAVLGGDGAVLVGWQEWTYPRGPDVAAARRISQAGVPLGPSTRIDSSRHVSGELSLGVTPSGYFAGWRWVRSGREYAFFGVPLDALGLPLRRDADITLPDPTNTIFNDVVGLPTGAALLWAQDGLWLRLLDADSNVRGGDFLVSEMTQAIWKPRAEPTADGGFVAVWESFYSDPPHALWARFFDAEGQPRGPQLLLSDDGSEHALAATPSGGIVVGVQRSLDPDTQELWLLEYDADAVLVSERLVHSVGAELWMSRLRVAFDTLGNLYVAWSEYGPPEARRVWVQAFDGTGPPLAPAAMLSDRRSFGSRMVPLPDGRVLNVWEDELGNDLRGNVMEVCPAGTSVCGDGVRTAGCEPCDDGTGNSDTLADACRTNCRLPGCGDGTVDSSEECDDGNRLSCDGCDELCRLEPGSICGDGIVNPACGEECDAGSGNGAGTDQCRGDCRVAHCGDGTVDAGEECDDGGTHDCDGCSHHCRLETAAPGLCAPQPVEELSAEQLARFDAGREVFVRQRVPTSGLGPIFNGRSCVECHNQPVVGGASPRLVERIGDHLEAQGGPVLQSQGVSGGACSVNGETVPPEASGVVSRRQAPPLFGMGLIAGVDQVTISKIRDKQWRRRHRHGIHGREGTPRFGLRGRFGWKAQIVSLHDFAAEAYIDEMGITSPFHPEERRPQGGPVTCDEAPEHEDSGADITRLTEFMRLLGPPPAPDLSREEQRTARRGKRFFRRADCHHCHTDKLRVGMDTAPSPAWSRKRLPLYSDLLLHDMGPGLDDGVRQGNAASHEWRTPPLWGVRLSAPYLHDGRAATLHEAILEHGGEASDARDAYLGLSAENRTKLLAFLESL